MVKEGLTILDGLTFVSKFIMNLLLVRVMGRHLPFGHELESITWDDSYNKQEQRYKLHDAPILKIDE